MQIQTKEATSKNEYLGNLISLEYGSGLTSSNRKGNNYPVFGSNGIVGFHDQYLIKGPGVIVGRKGSIGEVTWSDKDFWAIDTTYYVKLKNENISLKWIYYLLSHKNLRNLNSATGIPGLNRNDVYKMTCFYPSYKEQQKIASILSNVDELIQKIELIIKQTQRLKKSLVHILLTKGIGHTKFKDIELGFKFLKLSIPFDWNISKLEELVKFKDTPHYTSPYFDFGIPVIRTSDCMSNGRINYNNNKYTTEEEYEKRRKIIDPEEGDILYTREAPPGIASLVDRKKISIGQRIVLLKPLKNITGKYLLYFLNSKFGTLQANAMMLKTTVEHVNIEDIKKFNITVPALEEQTKITKYIEIFDDNIFYLINYLYCLKKLKKGLMQQLLTGKRKVII
jgi:type I restriction enzyme S subunit